MDMFLVFANAVDFFALRKYGEEWRVGRGEVDAVSKVEGQLKGTGLVAKAKRGVYEVAMGPCVSKACIKLF